MVIVRILLIILAIPFWILAKLLQGFFYVLTCISAKILQFIGGAICTLGIIFLCVELFGDAGTLDGIGVDLGMIFGGIGIYCIPYIGAFLSGLFDGIATFIQELAFQR